jgi:uncharacterized protein (DUF1330 family)
MAKGYWIARVDVGDTEGYKGHQLANAVAFRKYVGRLLARGGRPELIEVKQRSRHVIIEFKDYATPSPATVCRNTLSPRKNGKTRAIWTLAEPKSLVSFGQMQ